jgi:hypothetical protein
VVSQGFDGDDGDGDFHRRHGECTNTGMAYWLMGLIILPKYIKSEPR